jgi:hypothetical protein
MDNISRNTSRNVSKNAVSVDEEVRKLFKKGSKITYSDYSKLRSKYDEPEVVDNIQQILKERHSFITKKALKLVRLVRAKYGDRNFPYHVILEKSKHFKKKYNFNEDEFTLFMQIYEQELIGMKSPDLFHINTNMQKVLGDVVTEHYGYFNKLSDRDHKAMHEILKLYDHTSTLHGQVFLQAIQYTDHDPNAISGVYKKELNIRPSDSVHPIIAALFIPKIGVLEYHFLHSNIARIVKARYNNEEIVHPADKQLIWFLRNDPNDIICDNNSTMVDLLKRAKIQEYLWDSVVHLRNGQYYGAQLRNFVSAIDICKLNKYDNPELMYGSQDGIIMKRLLTAFCFRPTKVTILPAYQIVSSNPYVQVATPVTTSVPMLNLRVSTSINDTEPIELKDALEEHQGFFENGLIVPKVTNFIYSSGVLFFYVDRRANFISFDNEYSQYTGYNISRVPIAVSGFERISTREVIVKDEMYIRGDTYRLRSVVVSEISDNIPGEKNIVIGSSTLLIGIHTDSSGVFQEKYYSKYYPAGVVNTYKSLSGKLESDLPIRQVSKLRHSYSVDSVRDDDSFDNEAATRGIIFMYERIRRENEDGYIF